MVGKPPEMHTIYEFKLRMKSLMKKTTYLSLQHNNSISILLYLLVTSNVFAGTPIAIASGLNSPTALTLNGNDVYFSENVSTTLSLNTLSKISKEGGPVAQLLTNAANADSPNVYQGIFEIHFTATDIVVGYGGYNGHTIVQLPKNKLLEPQTITTFTGGYLIGVIGQYIYYGQGYSRIMKIPLGGGTPTTVLSGKWVRSSAVDNERIYFQEYYSKSVYSLDVTTNNLSLLMTSSVAGHIFIDDNHLFFNTITDGMSRVSKTGGAVVSIINGPNIYGYASDNDYVYYTENNNIKKMTIDGESQELLLANVNIQMSTKLVTVDDGFLYFADSSNGLGAGVIKKISKYTNTSSFGWPLTSSIDQTRITQPYACFDCTEDFPNAFHSGIDMRPCDAANTTNCVSSDKKVLAVGGGTVCKIIKNGKKDGGFGNAIIIDHANGLFSFYAHLADVPKNSDGVELKENKKCGTADQTCNILKNQQIGVMGGTGSGKSNTYPEHLHFGVLEMKNCNNTGKGYYPEHPGIHGIVDPWRHFERTFKASPTSLTVVRDPILGVRTGPSIRSNFMDANDVALDQRFVTYAETSEWLNIDLPCGQKSGVSGTDKACSGWVKKNDDSCRSSDKKCVVIEKTMNRVKLTDTNVAPVRTSPGTTYPMLLGLSGVESYPLRIWKGQEFPVRSGPLPGADEINNKCASNKWYEIDVTQDTRHLTGWVCGDNLTFTK